MKTVVNKDEIVKEGEFPKLMVDINDGDFVVLFSSSGIGVVVSGEAGGELGYNSTDWSMAGFHDFRGSITIRND